MKNKKITVLHVLTSGNLGGAEKFCVSLCNEQSKSSDMNVNLCILDSFHDDQPLLSQLSPSVTVSSLDKKGGYDLSILYKMYSFIKKLSPDIIHLNGRSIIYSSFGIIATGTPSVYTVHTFADKEYNKYFAAYSRLLINHFSKLFFPVAIGKTVSKTIQDFYGDKFKHVIYNGTPQLVPSEKEGEVHSYINSLKKTKDTLVFLYVGRIAPEKNTLLLIESFNRLLDQKKDVLLLVIGYDSTMSQEYLPKCEDANKHEDQIIFLGRKDFVADYISGSDAVCISSLYEGLSIVSLEAFSMGIPSLSTPSGGPEEIIIPGKNGLVSTSIDVESYTSMLSDFISKPIKNKEEIMNIYKNKYTMEACSNNYFSLYQKRIDENNS